MAAHDDPKVHDNTLSRRTALGVAGGLIGATVMSSAAAASATPRPAARFEGRVAVITGAARGIGRSHAVALAREGASVVACDILGQIATVAYPMSTQADMDETERLVLAAGGQFLAIKADVRDSGAANAAIEQALQRFSKVDFVLANAGIYESGPVLNMSDAAFDDVIRTNLYGVFHIMRAALPAMIRQRFGRIVATASTAGRQGLVNSAHYCASKWGVIGLTKALALEVAKEGITVNSVCPTGVNTPLLNNPVTWRQVLADDPAPTREKFEANRKANAATPQGVPWIEPADVTAAALFLLSDEARHITGSALDVTAGGSANGLT